MKKHGVSVAASTSSSSQANTPATTTAATTAAAASPPTTNNPTADFGDVSQYKELNAIGTGKVSFYAFWIFSYLLFSHLSFIMLW